jgi:hypothetical protein
MKVEVTKCNLRYSSHGIVDRFAKYQHFFVGFLEKVGEVNVFTDGEGSRGEHLHRRRRRDKGRERNERKVKGKQYFNE